jgi:hypothetical protein
MCVFDRPVQVQQSPLTLDRSPGRGVFYQSRLNALVDLYYGPANVEPATKSPPPASLQDGDRYFDFRP